MSEERIAGLVAQFNGLIKYRDLLADHPDWTDEQCLEFARKWHAKALEQRARDPERWSEGIPHCRNIWREDLA